MKKIKFRISALVFGIITAICAVLAQVYFSFTPPAAYGVCMICHARDLMNTIFNNFDWYSATVSSVAIKGPVVTTVGVIVGAFIAAAISGEFKFRISENIFRSAICGAIVVTAGLVISGCPMRLLLRTAYGDEIAAASIFTLIIGIALGTLILKGEAKLRARRKTQSANKEVMPWE